MKDAYVNFLTHCYIDTEVDHGGVGVHYLTLLKFKSLNILLLLIANEENKIIEVL